MERAKQIADALGLISDNNMGDIAGEKEMRELVEEYFLAPGDDDDADEYTDVEDSSDDELDLDDSGYTHSTSSGSSKLTTSPDRQSLPIPMEVDSDEEEPAPAVIVQPVREDGESDLPLEQRELLAGHRHEQLGPDVDLDLEEAKQYMCTCTYHKGGPCFKRYSPEELVDCRDHMKEMTSGNH